MKFFALGLCVLALVACGSNSDNTLAPGTPLITLDSDGQTVNQTRTAVYNLDINGSGNTVNFGDGTTIAAVNLNGSNNLLTFTGVFSVDVINVTGDDNTIKLPMGSNGRFSSNVGSGNQIIEY